jgi:signal transduction histidine kinase
MNTEIILSALAGLAFLAALGIACWSRIRTKKTMDTLDRMVDDAIRGDFVEDRFDESRLSSVETKLARYLSASALSAQNLREEREKIKALVSDISHQTKTPVANVLLYAQLLKEQELSEESRGCEAALESQAEKLQALIQALVKTSRLETGVLALHPVSTPLAPVLEASAAQLAPKAAAKGVTVTVEPTSAGALCDPKWTAEAVCNLLDNAVKYTPPGGRVVVRALPCELFSRVSVADSGPGIPEAERAKVFQRFYRGPENYGAEGVGIGLYLVRRIAEGQGGYVKVSSPRQGGAVFSLYLPRG